MMGRMMQVVGMRMEKEEEEKSNKKHMWEDDGEKEKDDEYYYYDCDEDEGGRGGGKSKRKNDSYGRMWKGKDKSYKYNNINMNMYVMVATLYLAAAAAEATVFPRRSLLNNVSPPPPPASSNWSSAPLYTSDTLEYYVHALSNSTAYTSSAPPSPNWSSSFGLSAAFDYNVTASSSADSAPRGFIRGFEVVDSLSVSPMSILVLNSIAYNDGYFVGSLSLHGAANVNDTDYDIAIAGGTGSFRGAAGVASITNLRTPGSDHVFRHILHFTRLAHY